MASSPEDGNVPPGSIKCGAFLMKLRDCRFVKKDSIPWSYYPTPAYVPAISVDFTKVYEFIHLHIS
jgi:hypothetical protein